MENKTNRIQDLIKEHQSTLKSQRKLLDNYSKNYNDQSSGVEDDVDRIVNSILSEGGLSDSLFTGNEEQLNGLNLAVIGDLSPELSEEYSRVPSSSLKKLIGEVDVNILETTKDTFDKGIQADLVQNNQLCVAPEHYSGLKNHTGGGSNKRLSISIPLSPADLQQSETVPDSGKLSGIKTDTNQEKYSPSGGSMIIEENNNEILKSSEFMDFFSRASRLIERALGEGAVFDPFFNINSENIESNFISENDISTKNPGNISISSTNGLLKNSMIFQHEISSNRPVMNIKSHPTFPEYFIAAYGTKFPQNSSFEGMMQSTGSGTMLNYGGCVQLWSISTPKKPENTFVASSPVLTTSFDPCCQYRYIGTSYNGEVLIWDSRNGKIPCQKSNSINISDSEGNNIGGHSFPVYCMELLGNKGSQSVITIDTDGKLCNWNLTNLSEPVESFQMRKTNSKDVSILCMTLSKLINPNAIICGSEDGSLYQTMIRTNKPGVISSTFQNAHNGYITSLDYHPINDCFLSSGADWTIKLWTPNPLANSFTLLYSFESSENYVIGVAWHPVHPGIFAAIDADSRLIIYDLTNPNCQTPLCKINTSCSTSTNSTPNTSDIPTCISWSTDGTRLFIGYMNGNVIMCNADSKLYQPNRNVWDLFNQQIETFKNNNSVDLSSNMENKDEENVE
ncbi:dynein intermediate chain [Cryptosporidium ubiquitum]|uniref:Dynein intermediate chain n=1 Tax=Cryptosporidium ubiquitum TaxID=857276 RepID=A0A1J4MNJ4_9CRYT|nr:dynein intermediate chain [Cryptosporidium ubiquitum]OII74596.1 dynein intermediate chain [Cryptosporidium ubiquitum]